LLLDPEEGYQKAKYILQDNFERRNVIARAHMEKLRNDSHIKADNKKGLVRLAHDLESAN